LLFWFPPSQGPKRAALSQEPETAWRPSGVTVTALAESVWPWNVVLVSPLARSQTRSVLSQEPETAWRPDQKLTGGVSPLAKVSVYLFASLVLPFRVLPLYVFACNEFLVLHVCN
jgi:hypothetical protein